ncbi:MAG: hypothetical protein BHV98_03235 [Clostridium sp. CAG:217_53_7]|nr:MAG: hypothetical protein BHV98_03235 [Clostridium sp. CAG:217_53_7]
MATLYELTGQAAQLMELLEAGEIDEQTVQDTLDSMMVPEKLEDYGMVIRQLTADVEDYKREKEFFADKQRRADNAIKRMKKTLGRFVLTSTSSKSVDVFNLAAVPAEYMQPQPPKVDKQSIRNALLAGETVAGAALIETPGCVIK